jgi:uncharacterized protein (DUF2225 family)
MKCAVGGKWFAASVIVCVAVLSLSQASPAKDPDLSLLGRTQVSCPVCSQTFTTITCVQTNTRGGIDRDLFARALGPQPEFFRISTCPVCGYSGYLSDFEPGMHLEPGVAEQILDHPKLSLPEGFDPTSDPRELDATDRYELAITCYQLRHKSDEALGWLYLRLSWVYRDRGSILPPDSRLERVMKYIQRWRPPLEKGGNQLDVEMQLASRVAEAIATGEFNRYQKPYVELALALVLRRHGENRQVTPMLDRLFEYEGFSSALRAGLQRMQHSISDEQRCQKQAVERFERAMLAEQITPENLSAARYVTAELHRRLGQDSMAIRWYDKVLNDGTLDAHLRTWAKEQRTWCQRSVKREKAQ